MNPAIVYDCETTGIPLFEQPSEDPRQPHIVQLAACLVDLDTRDTIASIDVIVRPRRPYYPHWISSPGSADYPQALPYVTCQAPSGLHTRYMGEVVDATSGA